MGRPEKPVNPEAPPSVRRIAIGLRVQRHQAGLSYPELANRVGYSVASLAAAASGHKLPTKALTRAYVQGCGGDVATWERRWVAANAELHGLSKPPVPTEVDDPKEFAACLRELLRWHGLSSLHEIAAATGVSRSTVNRALTGATLPTARMLTSLLAACELDDDAQRAWVTTRIHLLGLPNSVDDVFDDACPRIDSGPPPLFALDELDLSAFRAELRELRRGRGVADPNLFQRIGPHLLQLCGAGAADSYLMIRDKLTRLLLDAAADLAPTERLVVSTALNLPDALPGIRGHYFLQQRVEALATRLERDPRTTRRRIDQALAMLAESLIHHRGQGR